MSRRLVAVMIVSAVLLASPGAVLAQALPSGQSQAAPGQPLGGGTTGLANPASVFCVNCGGAVSIRDGQGGQYGVCQWPSGVEVEEWTWYRMFPHTIFE